MILLPGSLAECPVAWQNYIKAINPHGDLEDGKVDEITEREWNAYISYVDNLPHGQVAVQFKAPADELLFILRWG